MCSESAYSCLPFLELLGLTNGGVLIQMYVEQNIPSLCKKPSLNLHRGTLLLEKWVRRSVKHLQKDVCTVQGTAESIESPCFKNAHFRGSDTTTVSILI